MFLLQPRLLMSEKVSCVGIEKIEYFICMVLS